VLSHPFVSKPPRPIPSTLPLTPPARAPSLCHLTRHLPLHSSTHPPHLRQSSCYSRSETGTILTSLLETYPAYDLTLLLRPSTDPHPFTPLGVNIKVATTEKDVSAAAREYDVVIHEASASNVPWVKGLISGLEHRARKHLEEEGHGTCNGEEDGQVKRKRGGKKPIFMYGGGTGVMEDDCRGEYAGEKIWSVSRVAYPVT
jgi:hypothetical protein